MSRHPTASKRVWYPSDTHGGTKHADVPIGAIQCIQRDERADIVRQMRLHAARIAEYYEDSGFSHEHVMNLLIQTIAVSAPDPPANHG